MTLSCQIARSWVMNIESIVGKLDQSSSVRLIDRSTRLLVCTTWSTVPSDEQQVLLLDNIHGHDAAQG